MWDLTVSVPDHCLSFTLYISNALTSSFDHQLIFCIRGERVNGASKYVQKQIWPKKTNHLTGGQSCFHLPQVCIRSKNMLQMFFLCQTCKGDG